MARTESRTQCAIWEDEDFLALSERAQRMYWLLYSQSSISLCGVLALRPRYWVTLSRTSNKQSIQDALDELAATDKPFIVVDHATEEAWVRSFIKNDRVCRTPKVRSAAYEQLRLISSRQLRAFALAELDTHSQHPGAPIAPTESGPPTGSTAGEPKPQVNTLSRQTSDTSRAPTRAASTPSPSPSPSTTPSPPGIAAARAKLVKPPRTQNEGAPDGAGVVKPQVNTLSRQTSDTSRAPTRAASTPFPPPPPTPSPPGIAAARAKLVKPPRTQNEGAPDGAGVVAPQQEDEGASPDQLAHLLKRLEDLCVADSRSAVHIEAVALVKWASKALDLVAIDEEIGRCKSTSLPALPRFFAQPLQRRAKDARQQLEDFVPPPNPRQRSRATRGRSRRRGTTTEGPESLSKSLQVFVPPA